MNLKALLDTVTNTTYTIPIGYSMKATNYLQNQTNLFDYVSSSPSIKTSQIEINKDDFISFISVKKRLSKNTVRHCCHRFNVFTKWLKQNNKKICKQTTEDFFSHLINERHLKNNSINTYFFFLSQLNEYCKDRGILEGFLEGFKSFPKTRPHIEILSPDEIEKLINAERTYANRNGVDNSELAFKYSTLVMFLAYSGCRLNEAISLKIENLDLTLGRAIFVETKNKETREIFLAELIISRLKVLVENRSKQELVFLSSIGKKIVPQAFEHELKLRAKMVGLTKRVSVKECLWYR